MKVAPVNFKVLAHILAVEGFDPAGALKGCGIASADELDDDGPWLPVSLLDQSMAAAIEITGDVCFGLVAGRSLGSMRYPVFTQLALVAPNLRQILEDLQHFALLFAEWPEVELVEPRGPAEIIVRPIVENGRSGNFRTELIVTGVVRKLRYAQGGSADIEVDLPYACPPGQEARYTAALGPRIRFGQKRCVIRFSPHLLDNRLETEDPVVYAATLAVGKSALAAGRAGIDVAEKVRRWLLATLPHQPSVQQTAEQFRMTERSLRRHLCSLGITHAELAQECRRLEAEQLLADREVPIKCVADRLGFSSVTSFHRAFRRWTRMTPAQWRTNPGASGTPGNR